MNNIILTKIKDFDNRNYRNKALKFMTAQKMVHKLLSCERLEKIEIKRPRYTKQELFKTTPLKDTLLDDSYRKPNISHMAGVLPQTLFNSENAIAA